MHTLKFIISFTFCLFISLVNAQKDMEKTTVSKDSIKYKTGYGLRIGIDISKPIMSAFSDTYSGLELVGDYRISKRWYIATELGYEKETTDEEVLNVTSSGSYIRLGSNYNAYNNWLDMNNEIYVGGRYGLGLFNQILNSYTPNVSSQYFPAEINANGFEMNNLNIHWLEFQAGIKVETFKNLFVSFHGSYKVVLSVSEPKGFQALYAAGFNRIYESNTGFGFNYTISYLIPFAQK